MPSWAWILATVVVLCIAAVALGACQRGYDNPIVLGTLVVADAVSGEGPSEADQRQWNADAQKAVADLKALCTGIETGYRDTATLKANAARAEALGLAVGHNIMDARMKACVAFHAESAGHFEPAYRLFFGAAIDSAYDRKWATEHGTPPKVLPDVLHYAVLDAIIRLRAAGHAIDIYHVGSEMVTGYTCAQLRREAPQYATCR